MKPWVSILTPLYNGVEFLEECAKSVCVQVTEFESTSFTWEWLIAVNGHGDGGEVLEAARRVAGANIRILNLPTVKGKVEALNAMVPLTTGDWIAVLDCDDMWEANKLMTQRLTIDRSPRPIGVIGTWCSYFGEVNSNGPALPSGWISPESIRVSNPIINSSVLVARHLAYWEDRFGLEDYDLWLRLARSNIPMFNVPLRLVNHRIHRGSAFNGKGRQDVKGLQNYHLKLAAD